MKNSQFEEEGAKYRFLHFFQDLLKRFSVFKSGKRSSAARKSTV